MILCKRRVISFYGDKPIKKDCSLVDFIFSLNMKLKSLVIFIMIMLIVNHSELVYGTYKLPGDIEFPWRLYFVICVINNSVYISFKYKFIFRFIRTLIIEVIIITQ